jgi:hypothetical protein
VPLSRHTVRATFLQKAVLGLKKDFSISYLSTTKHNW